jgi:hypothetical protein
MVNPSEGRFLLTLPARIQTLSVFSLIHADRCFDSTPQVKALILENTFMNLPSLIPSAMPFLSPVSFLCHQKWESEKKLPKIPSTTPVLMLSGVRDEIVPKEHMKGLWELVKNRRKDSTNASASSGPISETSDKDGEGKIEEVADAIGKSRFVEFENGFHSELMF